jgi:pimeloyl-ACP methyl ester carboxylesterase
VTGKLEIKKHYADTPVAGGTIQTHYRAAGRGAPLVMLHPSPLSSAFMQPLMAQLADLAHAIAPDTPGYGMSDALPQPGNDLQPYVQWLAGFLEALQLPAVTLYGSATGAQIAIEFAKAHPQQVGHLVLDNAVHFEDAERADIMQHYFPCLAPQADGSHLQLAWKISDALFRCFPWYAETGASAGGPEPPVALVHATAMGYLQAGEDYARAYRAAFNNERAERLKAVPVPTSVIRWQGSILRLQADRLDSYEWPEHIRMVHCGASPQERFAAIRKAAAAGLSQS